MTTPLSSAAALHKLLTNLYRGRPSGRTAVYQSWADSTEFDVETPSFLRYHADSLTLLAETMDEVASLGEEVQASYIPYLESWWTALVQPRYDWASANGPALEDASLHILGTLAALVEASSGPRERTADESVQLLADATSHLIDLLEADSELPEGAKLSALKSLRYLSSVIRSSDIMGLAHVRKEAKGVSGDMMMQSLKLGVQQAKLRSVAVALLVALGVAEGVSADVASIATNARETFSISASQDGEPKTDPVTSTVVVVCGDSVGTSRQEQSDSRALPGAPRSDEESSGE